MTTGLGVEADLLLAGIEWTPGTTQPGSFKIASRIAKHRALMERAATLREGQTGTSDVAALVREARDELEQRTERWKEDEEEEG